MRLKPMTLLCCLGLLLGALISSPFAHAESEHSSAYNEAKTDLESLRDMVLGGSSASDTGETTDQREPLGTAPASQPGPSTGSGEGSGSAGHSEAYTDAKTDAQGLLDQWLSGDSPTEISSGQPDTRTPTAEELEDFKEAVDQRSDQIVESINERIASGELHEDDAFGTAMDEARDWIAENHPSNPDSPLSSGESQAEGFMNEMLGLGSSQGRDTLTEGLAWNELGNIPDAESAAQHMTKDEYMAQVQAAIDAYNDKINDVDPSKVIHDDGDGYVMGMASAAFDHAKKRQAEAAGQTDATGGTAPEEKKETPEPDEDENADTQPDPDNSTETRDNEEPEEGGAGEKDVDDMTDEEIEQELADFFGGIVSQAEEEARREDIEEKINNMTDEERTIFIGVLEDPNMGELFGGGDLDPETIDLFREKIRDRDSGEVLNELKEGGRDLLEEWLNGKSPGDIVRDQNDNDMFSGVDSLRGGVRGGRPGSRGPKVDVRGVSVKGPAPTGGSSMSGASAPAHQHKHAAGPGGGYVDA